MKLLSYFIIIAITACILSCGNKSSSDKQEQSIEPVKSSLPKEEEEWIPDEYKTSELAELMRTMHADHLLLKSKIEKGELDLIKETDYSSIKTATPTDPSDSTPLFQVYSQAYLLADNAIYKSKTTLEYKNSFNNMVNSCIGCHQNFCLGPIAKIELLRIQP